MTSAADRARRQALVADIGGTHARFAIADLDSLAISDFAVFRVADYPSLSAAIAAYGPVLRRHRPVLAGFAVAGPLGAERIAMTNAPWSFTPAEIRHAAGVDHIHFVNDFEAVALSLPSLPPAALRQVGGGNPAEGATKAALGPGTGLGVGALVRSPSRWIAVPAEGGHVTFAPENAAELAIVEKLRASRGHVAVEDLVSGPGLVALYRILSGRASGPLAAPDIVAHAFARDDPFAEQALKLFVTWLGRFAGDIAMVFGARGGVYLAGGIPPKIIEALTTGMFRAAFEAKGRMAAYVAPIPIFVIMSEDAGLRGAAIALSAALAEGSTISGPRP